MTNSKQHNRVLLISDDKFLAGVLTGYSAANHFQLDNISCVRLFEYKTIDSVFRHILLDHRHMSNDLIEASLGLLQGLHSADEITICVIHNQQQAPTLNTVPWVDCYMSEPTIEQLGSYINNILLEQQNERRNKLRRVAGDRRAANEQKCHNSNIDIFVNTDEQQYEFGPFKIDRSCRAVFFKGKDLELTGKEFKLFCLLVDSPERVCTTDKIIKHLWPETHRATKSDLYQYMHLLRKKVEQDPYNPHWILTVKGVGYKLQAISNLNFAS